MPSVLFVCTANRFRSPLAAALLKKNLEERGIADAWQVGSAGTWTTSGKPVLSSAYKAARRFGIDLSRHRSREVSQRLLAGYDLILVMQESHKEALCTEFPRLHERIYLLSDVAARWSYDIPDLSESGKGVEEIAAELDSLIRRGLDDICLLAASPSKTFHHSERSYE